MLKEIKRAFTENKTAILVSTAIFVISAILGFCLEGYLYSYLNPVVEDLSQKVQSGVIKVTFHDIFFNNLRVICVMFICGIIFCFSAVMLAFNGFFIGYYVAISQDFFTVLMYILPHGIFELPSCILACAASFVLFKSVYKFVSGLFGDSGGSISERFAESFDKLKQALILFAIAVVLMFIAGIIEAYFTAPIAQFVFSLG